MVVQVNNFYKDWASKKKIHSGINLKLFYVNGEVTKELKFVWIELDSIVTRKGKIRVGIHASQDRDINLQRER